MPSTSSSTSCTSRPASPSWPGTTRTSSRRSPETTEQVLHPEKYEAGEDPIVIDLPEDLEARIGPGFERTLDDTFGEFQTGVWLREAGAENATDAAAGWGGDRIVVLDDGTNWATILGTEWDSTADAAEFEAAAAALEPAMRLAKVSTEEAPALAQELQIQGIPLIVLFRDGREVARQAGAMPARQIVAWARQHAG